jgi:hypothetical protein
MLLDKSLDFQEGGQKIPFVLQPCQYLFSVQFRQPSPLPSQYQLDPSSFCLHRTALITPRNPATVSMNPLIEESTLVHRWPWAFVAPSSSLFLMPVNPPSCSLQRQSTRQPLWRYQRSGKQSVSCDSAEEAGQRTFCAG